MLVSSSIARVVVGRLEHGSDLLSSIKSIVKSEGIMFGLVYAIGAVKRAKLAYYNQYEKKYEVITIDKPMEILSCIGNVIGGDEVIVHLHITLGDSDGKAYGGHLLEGTEVFACEVAIIELSGVRAERVYDEKTGLKLLSLVKI